MKTLKYLTIFLFGAMLWWSFRPVSITTKVTGKVLSGGDALLSAKVSILDLEGKPLGYYEPTDKRGEYTLMFNASEGRAMKLKFEKEGYTTLVQDYIPQSKFRNFTFHDVHLVKVVPDFALLPTYKLQNINNPQVPTIKFYSSMEALDINYEEVTQHKIDHFIHIKRRDSINATNTSPIAGIWYEVKFKLKDSPKDFQGYIFEPHDYKAFSLN